MSRLESLPSVYGGALCKPKRDEARPVEFKDGDEPGWNWSSKSEDSVW
jgi:hypothetical protein